LENPYFERERPEEEPIVTRPRPGRIPRNYTGKSMEVLQDTTGKGSYD
jgi:hypothetical protein